MVENQESNNKLLKEVLSRANKKEKQAYNTQSNKQLALLDSISEVRVQEDTLEQNQFLFLEVSPDFRKLLVHYSSAVTKTPEPSIMLVWVILQKLIRRLWKSPTGFIPNFTFTHRTPIFLNHN
jgi:hypothetical protein